jgi:hypothetical protein
MHRGGTPNCKTEGAMVCSKDIVPTLPKQTLSGEPKSSVLSSIRTKEQPEEVYKEVLLISPPSFFLKTEECLVQHQPLLVSMVV